MSTDDEQLQAIKSQTLALIAEMTASPKPSYTIDGQRVEWADYLNQLRLTVQWCDAQLAAGASGEVHTRGCT